MKCFNHSKIPIQADRQTQISPDWSVSSAMAEGEVGGGRHQIPNKYDLDAKWDACIDFSLRRVLYSTVAGAFGGLLLFRSPVTRWASVALGAGVGIGSAYTECSHLFNTSPPKLADKASSQDE